MTRSTLVALALLSTALLAVGAGVWFLARRDRAALVERFGAERLQQLGAAAHDIQGDFDDIAQHLRFAAQLVETTTSSEERSRELGALLAVVKPYRMMRLYDGSGAAVLSVTDPLASADFHPEPYDAALAETARRALANPSPSMQSSPPIPGDPTGWNRVFAVALPARNGRPAGAISVLVDTEVFFTRLRLVTVEPTSRVLLVSPYGGAAPASDPVLSRALADVDRGRPTPPALAALVAQMRAGRQGVVSIGEREAPLLGLGPAEIVAAYAPIRLDGGAHWSVAEFTSTASLRDQQRAALARLGMASAAVALCLIGFGAYIVVAARRTVEMRERIRHAETLAHLHEKTEKILDNIPTGVMAISEQGLITAINRALRERTATGVMGGPLASAFPDAPAAVLRRLDSLVDAARANERVQSLFGEHVALFGAEGQYNLHAVPLEPRFREARVLLVIEDLTEVRSLESQLLRAEKLATVGVLAAGIAHEIGSPLGVVRGRAEYVAGKLGPNHPQADGMHVIVDQIDHVTRTLRQLLDFARVKPAPVRAVQIAHVARSVAELVRFECEKRKIWIDVFADDDLPPLAADVDQLQQVLVNLVLNALDACSPGGHVRIAARPESAIGWTRVRIEVIDDGCGIPETQRHQVFDPFFTTKKRGQGTGLGLTIAAQIVRNHGGQIELASEPGRGTQVAVLWPVATASEESHDAAS